MHQWGAFLWWIAETLGLAEDSGMAGGIIIFALGGYVVWAYVFFVIAYLGLKQFWIDEYH
ncbi:hypothetical protein [Microbulbifer sp. SAOS-129_SWC]|uniref:hypothetical protein n=1 Tax=Microbulbifer sp. SAOS-129_SWC TaxID=3145235 RepID=UPI003216B411